MRLAVAMVVVVGALAAGSAALADGPVELVPAPQDPVGDTTAPGPDISAAAVSSDAGTVNVRVDLANRAALQDGETIQLQIDADANLGSGAPGGFDLNFVAQGPDGSVGAYAWNGSTWAPAATRSLTGETGSGSVTYRFARSDFEIVEVMRFVVLTTTSAGGAQAIADRGPDRGIGWIFEDVQKPASDDPDVPPATTPPAARPLAVRSVSAPARVRRGGLLVVRLRLAGTGAAHARGKVACAARVGTKPLRAKQHSLARGVATCAWRIPRASAARSVTGSIRLRAGSLHVTRRFSTALRP